MNEAEASGEELPVVKVVGMIVRTALLLFVAACASPAPRVEAHVPPPPPPVVPVVTPEVDPICEKAQLPPVRGTIVLSEALVRRALSPVLHAVCACTRPGQHVRLVATLTPALGTSSARMPNDTAGEACLARFPIGRYEPFDVGSDCIDCGPRHYGIFHGRSPPPPPPSETTVSLAFELVR